MQWLKEIRLRQSKTTIEVAKTAGISRAAYCNIENGRRKPAVKTAQAIASVLGFDWTRFFEE